MADTELLDRIKSADSLNALEDLRVAALGKSGSITAMLKTLGQMDADTRAVRSIRSAR